MDLTIDFFFLYVWFNCLISITSQQSSCNCSNVGRYECILYDGVTLQLPAEEASGVGWRKPATERNKVLHLLPPPLDLSSVGGVHWEDIFWSGAWSGAFGPSVPNVNRSCSQVEVLHN